MRQVFLALVLVALIIPGSYAVYWDGSVETNTSSWSIHRQGANISFDLSSSVEGEIVPIIGPGGRVLDPFHSHYTDIDVNDVRLKERTGALEGIYSSEDQIWLRTEAKCDINMTEYKPAGSDIWTITFKERWPVTLNASRTVDYQGTNINDRENIGNNYDFVGSSFLYNREYSKKRDANLRLERMNATVVATNDSIIRTAFMPTKSTIYGIESHSTGIVNLKYLQTDSRLAVVGYGEERYQGTYDISRKMVMTSVYAKETNEADWLTCCLGGFSQVECGGAWNELEVFDCVCS